MNIHLGNPGKRRLKGRKGLRQIEAQWSRPMANPIVTRVRFTMWATMRFALKLVRRSGRASSISDALARDLALFDDTGMSWRKFGRKR